MKMGGSSSKAAGAGDTGILESTLEAYALAQEAAGALADLLATKAKSRLKTVQQVEQDLDRIDRQVDAALAGAVAGTDQERARELLTCMKMVIDLERVGDLFCSVATSMVALGKRLETEDAGDLIRMATILERMLSDTYGGFATRNSDRALAALRMDTEVDRLRNLMMIRHLESAPLHEPSASVHVLFMAQALERAGDHVKNLAEEICHLTSGQTLRHVVRGAGNRAAAQMRLEALQPPRSELASPVEREGNVPH